MRINGSALHHGITVEEINAVAAYPEHVVPLNPRREESQPVLHVGALNSNEPYIEVIQDLADGLVFHAMMLRMSTVTIAGLTEHIDHDRLATRQRS